MCEEKSHHRWRNLRSQVESNNFSCHSVNLKTKSTFLKINWSFQKYVDFKWRSDIYHISIQIKGSPSNLQIISNCINLSITYLFPFIMHYISLWYWKHYQIPHCPGYGGPEKDVPHEKFNSVPKSYHSPWEQAIISDPALADTLTSRMPNPDLQPDRPVYKCFNR